MIIDSHMHVIPEYRELSFEQRGKNRNKGPKGR